MFGFGSSEWMFLIVIGCSIWTYFDAKKLNLPAKRQTGFFKMGPIGWALSVLLLLIVSFPLYLFKRDEFQKINDGIAPSTISEASPTTTNRAAKFVAMAWSCFCLFGVVAGIAGMGEAMNDVGGNEYAMAGATIGAGIGLSIWFFAWVVIAGPATAVFFLTRKNIVMNTPQPEHKTNAETKKCPFCAETILKEANFCKHCKQDLSGAPAKKTTATPTKPTTQKTNWLNKGKTFLKAGEYKEAIVALDRHIKENKQDASAFYVRAVAFSKLKDKNRLIADLTEAARLGHPKAEETLKGLKK